MKKGEVLHIHSFVDNRPINKNESVKCNPTRSSETESNGFTDIDKVVEFKEVLSLNAHIYTEPAE